MHTPNPFFRLLCLMSALIALYAPRAMAAPAVSPSEQASLYTDMTQAGGRLLAVGQHGHIIFSDNQGDSWSWANTPVNTLLTAVYFVDEQHGWATGHDGVILHTQDGGTHWQLQHDGLTLAKDQGQERIKAAVSNLDAAENRLRAARANGDQSINYELEYNDAKVSLELARAAVNQPEADPFMDIWFDNARFGIAVGAFGLVKLTQDGGQNWQDISERLDNFEQFHFYAVAANARGQILIAGEGGSLFRSDDRGQHWQRLEPPYEGSLFGVTALSDTEVITYGLQGSLLYSADFGNQWRTLDTGVTTSLFNASPLGNSTLIVGDAGVYIELDDQGVHTRQTATRLPILSVAGTRSTQVWSTGPLGPQPMNLSTGGDE